MTFTELGATVRHGTAGGIEIEHPRGIVCYYCPHAHTEPDCQFCGARARIDAVDRRGPRARLCVEDFETGFP